MAEAAGLIGLVAAISQLIEYGVKLIDRLKELSSSINDKAGAFTAIKVRLPVVLATIKRTQKHVELQVLSSSDAKSLLPLIENTIGHVRSLLAIIQRSVPSEGAPPIARYIKAVKSLSRDKEVQRISHQLQENLQVLRLNRLYHAIRRSLLNRGNIMLSRGSPLHERQSPGC
jgi:hypothetical protein